MTLSRSKNSKTGAVKIAQWRRGLVPKPLDLNSIPGTHVVEEENLPAMCTMACVPLKINQSNNKVVCEVINATSFCLMVLIWGGEVHWV